MKPTIGWIGLGNMGKPMAQNLVNAGYQPWVHNRTAEKANFLVEQGAQYAETSKVVAEKAILSLPYYRMPLPCKISTMETQVCCPVWTVVKL